MIDEQGALKRIDYGGVIHFNSDNGIAGTTYPIGTAGMPSDVIADVITMAVALGFHTIDVHGALTLGATMEHYSFVGHDHEDIADILDISGEDVDGSVMHGMVVTGVQGGTGLLSLIECIVITLTIFNGRMENCRLYGSAFSFKDTGNIDLDDCESLFGQAVITVQAPTLASIKQFVGDLVLTVQDGGVCRVEGFKGSLEIDEMTAGTLDIYAEGADITINGDCTGGTINIWGNAVVTGAGGGVVINNYTLDANIATMDAIADNIILDTQIRTIQSGTKVINAGITKYLSIDSGTNGAEILSIVVQGVNGHDWTIDVYVPTDDAVGAPAAADKRDAIAYLAADTEGGLLSGLGIPFNAFLDVTNDGANDQIDEVTITYRSRDVLTLAWEA